MGRSTKDEQKHALMAALGAPAPPPEKKSRALIVVAAAVVIVVIVLGVGVARRKRGPEPERAVDVHAARIQSLREFTRLSDASATISVPASLELSFDFAGKLARVVEKGATVKAGDIVATLEDAKALEKELAHAREKQTFYEEELASARAGAHPSYIERAERKLAEKKQRADAIAASLAGTQIVSPRSGTVTAVAAKSGSPIKARTPVLTLQPTEKIAELQLPEAEAARLAKNQTLDLRSDAGTRGSGRVLSSENGTVLVEVQSEGSQLKLGDRVRFVQSKVTDAADVPITAVQTDKATRRDRIFVVDGTRATALPVMVLERRADRATVTGLKGGETVVVDPPPALAPGALLNPSLPTHAPAPSPAAASPAAAK